MYLGIDAGGTHTDAAVVEQGKVIAIAKVATQHDDLPSTIRAALHALRGVDLRCITRVTLGTTLAVNAVVQHKINRVGLLLSAGPGLAPERAALGEYVYVAQGGLDHRGCEVTQLDTSGIAEVAAAWQQAGVCDYAVVGKFSPRNTEHETRMAKALLAADPKAAITCGHSLSGALNFPRRVATAYYNAAVSSLYAHFIDAVESAFQQAGVHTPIRLLKADGGAVPLSLARKLPVQSILSGPAASVMGLLALCPDVAEQDSLLLDMGGTTTDIALYADGSPVLDRDGMRLNGRATLVRSLATVSIGVGGDSLIHRQGNHIVVGPLRTGPAAAFGGAAATLLDALNVLGPQQVGAADSSYQAVHALAKAWGMKVEALAQEAVDNALWQITQAVQQLTARVNAAPVYTLSALLENRQLRPSHAWLVGGPASILRSRVQEALHIPVSTPIYADAVNAIGAALTLPTASVELFADTGAGNMRIPSCDIARHITRSYTLEQAKADAEQALREYLQKNGMDDMLVEVVEADVFATLDEYGRGSKDIRVVCQLLPGIAQRIIGKK